VDAGVPIPKDDPVRLLPFVLSRFDLSPLYEAYDAYGEKRRREEVTRKREGAERGAGGLIAAEGTDTSMCLRNVCIISWDGMAVRLGSPFAKTGSFSRLSSTAI
jgi:putative IMPACT (imprinted ancient) family translation regulator